MRNEFSRIAIVNRGEAAVRLIRAVQELNREDGRNLQTIALYTDTDRGTLFVREADEAFSLGTATFADPADGRRKNRYLDYETLDRVLRESAAEAVWVGWGFVAEHAEFAELCRHLGIVFIGPDPEVMRSLGDKIGSKHMAEESGVPVAPWSGGAVETIEAAREHAERLGYPLMVKATAGGGGRGIRRVRGPEELEEAFVSARSEALAGFGDATVFMERLVEGARHVEVQIIGDGEGTTWALGVRDCTVQRRNQKVIEESPSPALSAEQQQELCDAAARLGTRAGYRNAGTVEFLYEPRESFFSFMEVNARLQVEHPVTEMTTGVDLVKLQIHIARGGRLEGEQPRPRGHAVEVRVNAEDPERGFAPAPGRIELFRLPGGPGLRVDSGFLEGDRISPDFDSMLAKVIAWGNDRGEAIARLERALGAMQVAVRGGASNKGFLLGLLRRPEVRSGEVDVGWLDRLSATGDHLDRSHADVALVQGAIEAYEAELSLEQAAFYTTAMRGRLEVRREIGLEVELRSRGVRYPMRVFRTGPTRYRVEVDGRRIEAEVEPLGSLERQIRIGDRVHRILSIADGLEQLVEVDGTPHRLSRDDAGTVRSPAPAVVVSIAVEEGDEVSRGDRLVVLEAMKSEISVLAPFSGVVRDVLVTANVQVDARDPLLLVEAQATEEEEEVGARVHFDALETPSASQFGVEAQCAARLDELKRLTLGFDFDPAEARRLADGRLQICGELPADHELLLAAEEELLASFADVCALFQHRTAVSDLAAGESRTAEEYLILYLRSLDPAAAGLPPSFIDRLQRTLAHYGIDSLDRTPQLEDTMLWICKAHERVAEQLGVVMAILERRLDECERLTGRVEETFRDLLDRIVTVTWGGHQAVSDLAREVRYRIFDRPFFEQIRDRTYAEIEASSSEAVGTTDLGRRAEIVDRIVACPQPLSPLLASRFEHAEPALRALMLEVLTRRYYRIRDLANLQTDEREGWSFASAHYQYEGRTIHVITTHADWKSLDDLWPRLDPLVAAVPGEHDVVIDVYLGRDTEHDDPDACAKELRERIAGHSFPRRVRRIVAAIVGAGGGLGMGAMQHFTFREGPDGIDEDRIYRGLHPMMGKRLQLWRLSNFDVERIPSVEDVYLFHGVARTNPRDERLFAFAEVRDLTPVRDAEDRIVHLPHLEMQYLEALAAIRRVQSRRSPRRRLHWNRLLLYVWPTVDLGIDELNAVAHRLVPAAEGLGLQKTIVRGRMADPETGEPKDTVAQLSSPNDRDVVMTFTKPADDPIMPLSDYGQRVVRMRQRGMFYPYELIRLLTSSREGARAQFPPGAFYEYDLDEAGELVRFEREPGRNRANMVVGVIESFTSKHPEGMKRVMLIGDASREMGSFAEPECRRIIAATDLAESLGVPLEWFPISAGAKIAMDSGTENLDWTAAALRRLIEFTQAGGEVNLIVAGINVGGQSYWNAEATMLMHTRGILIMTPEASMVLTGKKALDYSGGVSAEDHQGIGGYEKIMGVNGQSQYWARDLGEACHLLYRYYEHAYVAPSERFPRRAPTSDPIDRDIRAFPYDGGEGALFETVGDVFSEEQNPGRRKPFDIRRVMQAVIDQDHEPLERWRDMREAESAVVWDAHLGGVPACLIGIESHGISRLGFVPADGPDTWTAGTLFPLSSKKVARAINATSGTRPLVVLANLSGFDGSPESLRRLQLEYGAEIGRAVVNFDGPIVFCVVSRYHGGAYVVFSRTLHENLEVAALEGSYASVIGGAPAAAVVFAGDVNRRTQNDERLQSLEAEMDQADEATRGRLRARWHEVYETVRSEKLGEVADEFDSAHSVHRAHQVGSLHRILEPGNLRPYLVDALERGMQREVES